MRGGKLQLIERYMGVVKIQRGNAARIRREIAQDVAAARGDGNDVIARLYRQGFQVHDGIFPNLRIDQPLERSGEETLAQPRFRHRPSAKNCLIKARRRGAPCA